MDSLFGHPLVAAALGALLGVFLTFLSRWAVTRVTPQDPAMGMAVVALMMGARFALALAALGAYYFFAREGLVVFGVALTVSFVAGLTVEAVKASCPHASRTSA